MYSKEDMYGKQKKRRQTMAALFVITNKNEIPKFQIKVIK